MRVLRFYPRLGYFPAGLAVPHDVNRNARVVAVAAFHHYNRCKVAQAAGGRAGVVQGLELLSEQDACFEKVRGGNGSRRQEHFAVGANSTVVGKAPAGGGHKDRVDHQRREAGSERSHLPDNFFAVKDASFRP